MMNYLKINTNYRLSFVWIELLDNLPNEALKSETVKKGLFNLFAFIFDNFLKTISLRKGNHVPQNLMERPDFGPQDPNKIYIGTCVNLLSIVSKYIYYHCKVTGACGQDFCYPPPLPLFSCVPMIIYFAYKISNLGVFLFQYIKQIPGINGF